MKQWMKIAIGVVAVLILMALVVPLFVNADSFRPMLESQLSSALGRKVTLGKLSFSLWSGSVVADQLAVADDPAFSTTPFLQATALKIGVDVGALLFHHQVNVRKFVVESPEIHLISNEKGAWNYATLTQNGASSGSGGAAGTAANLTVGKLEVDDGKIVVASVPAHGQPFVWSDVKIAVQNVSTTQAMPFTMSANLPGNGSLALTGTAGPLNQQDATATPLRATLTVKGFNPVTAGLMPASAGIAMDAEIDAQVTSDGKTLASTGKMKAQNLQLAPGGSPSAEPVNLTYSVNEELATRTGQVQDLAMQSGSVAVHAQGSFVMAGPAVTLDLHVNAPQLPVDGVEALLPVVGVRLPTGSQLKGGTLTAQLAITGTTTAPVITGPIEVDNTQLAGFDLASKIEGLKQLTGTGGGTAIKTLKADVRETSAATELTNIDADVPALGTATGIGTVTAAGALNFQLVAKLGGSGAMGAMTTIAGGLVHAVGSNGVPLTITGTTSNPVIRADVAQMVKGGLLGQAVGKKGVGGALGKLLGPK